MVRGTSSRPFRDQSSSGSLEKALVTVHSLVRALVSTPSVPGSGWHQGDNDGGGD